MPVDYTEMVIRLAEMTEVFDEPGEQDLNAAEPAYFLEVYISEHYGNG